MMTDPFPLACLLPDLEKLERREQIVHTLFQSAQDVRELPDGYGIAFPGESTWLSRLAEFIAFERDCCPFFTFEMLCEPNRGPIWLHLRGPDGVKEMLQGEFPSLFSGLSEEIATDRETRH